MEKIKVIICPTNRAPYVTHISNTLENLQRIVGGPIEMVRIVKSAVAICNEEGLINGLPENKSFLCDGIHGDCIICDTQDAEFVGLNDIVCRWLLIHCKARWNKEGNG